MRQKPPFIIIYLKVNEFLHLKFIEEFQFFGQHFLQSVVLFLLIEYYKAKTLFIR